MSIDIYYDNSSIGEVIKKLREKSFPGKSPARSQLDLSLDIGWDNPSTLSRIESGKVIPSRKTLIKICKTLKLNRLETDFLLNKLGYGENRPQTQEITEKYIQKMVKMYSYEIDNYTFPTMFEYGCKIIYMNKAAHDLFVGNSKKLDILFREKTYLELIFFKKYGIRQNILNWKEFAKYVAQDVNILLPVMTGVPYLLEVLDSLQKFSIFRKLGRLDEKLNISNLKYHNIPFIYNHPKRGKKSFSLSQFPSYFDDRFHVIQFIPN